MWVLHIYTGFCSIAEACIFLPIIPAFKTSFDENYIKSRRIIWPLRHFLLPLHPLIRPPSYANGKNLGQKDKLGYRLASSVGRAQHF